MSLFLISLFSFSVAHLKFLKIILYFLFFFLFSSFTSTHVLLLLLFSSSIFHCLYFTACHCCPFTLLFFLFPAPYLISLTNTGCYLAPSVDQRIGKGETTPASLLPANGDDWNHNLMSICHLKLNGNVDVWSSGGDVGWRKGKRRLIGKKGKEKKSNDQRKSNG